MTAPARHTSPTDETTGGTASEEKPESDTATTGSDGDKAAREETAADTATTGSDGGGQDPSEGRTSEPGTVGSGASEDKATNEPTTEDKTTRNRTTADQAPRKRTTTGKTPRKRTTTAKTTDKQTTTGKTPRKPTTADQATDNGTTDKPTTTDQATTDQAARKPTTTAKTPRKPTTADHATDNTTTDKPTTTDQATTDQAARKPTTTAKTPRKPTTADHATDNTTTDKPTTTDQATKSKAPDTEATDKQATEKHAPEHKATEDHSPENHDAPEDDGFEDARTVLVRAKSSGRPPAAAARKAPGNRPAERQETKRPEATSDRAESTGDTRGDIGDTRTVTIRHRPAPSATRAAEDAKAALRAFIAADEDRSATVDAEPEPEPESEQSTITWTETKTRRRRGGRHRRRASRWRTFFFILWRDIFVTGREIGPFLGQVIVEPFFMLFVFGKVLGEIGYTQPGFEQVLLPGVVALNSFLVALQNTALPLAIDFSWTKEIEDRLLAPIPVSLVAVEKAVFGAMRGLIGSVVMIPIGLALLDNVSWPLAKMPETIGILSLGGLVGGVVGLTLGTLAPARHISIVFAMTLTPIMFTGATQFPYLSLGDVRWFQILCTLNPLTYVSEAMRGLLLPPQGPDSIPLWICGAAITAAILIFGFIGVRGFNRRAQD